MRARAAAAAAAAAVGFGVCDMRWESDEGSLGSPPNPKPNPIEKENQDLEHFDNDIRGISHM